MMLLFFLFLAIFAEENNHTTDTKTENIEVGLNTVDLNEEGNWLLKKLWWQEGLEAYTEIQKTNNNLSSLQLDYLTLKSNSERELDSSWIKLGFDDEHLVDNLDMIIEKLNKDAKEKKPEVDNKDENKAENLLKTATGLKDDLSKIAQYQFKLDDVIEDVVSHLKKCRSYETQSWDYLQQIAKTLDDNKARLLYLEIEANLKNIKNLVNYLNIDLKKYANDLINEQQGSLDKIKNALEELKNNGIEISQNIEKIDEEIMAAEKREKAHKEALRKASEKKKQSRGFFEKLWDNIYSWFK